MALLKWIIETSMKMFISNRVKVELVEMGLLINHKKPSALKEHLQKMQAFFWCNNFLLGHLHLKVGSASIAAFRILLAILLHFVWILSKNFSFFNISRKSLLNTYILKTSKDQRHIWTSERIFCFGSCMGVKQNIKIS